MREEEPVRVPRVGDDVGGDVGGDEGGDEGGDPACWLPRVCRECGRLADEDPPTVCPACGAEIPAD